MKIPTKEEIENHAIKYGEDRFYQHPMSPSDYVETFKDALDWIVSIQVSSEVKSGEPVIVFIPEHPEERRKQFAEMLKKQLENIKQFDPEAVNKINDKHYQEWFNTQIGIAITNKEGVTSVVMQKSDPYIYPTKEDFTKILEILKELHKIIGTQFIRAPYNTRLYTRIEEMLTKYSERPAANNF